MYSIWTRIIPTDNKPKKKHNYKFKNNFSLSILRQYKCTQSLLHGKSYKITQNIKAFRELKTEMGKLIRGSTFRGYNKVINEYVNPIFRQRKIIGTSNRWQCEDRKNCSLCGEGEDRIHNLTYVIIPHVDTKALLFGAKKHVFKESKFINRNSY